MIDRAGEPMIVARASYISNDVSGVERFMQLTLPAVQEALNPVREFVENLPLLPLLVGLPAQRPGLTNNLATKIIERLKNADDRSCRFAEIGTIACGHSAGVMAIEEGCRKIRNGSAEFCLVGGVDSYLEPETLEWLDEEEQLHSEKNKWGFAPGEAAGFCLLTSQQTAEKYRISVLGVVLATAKDKEPDLIKADSVCTGEGLTKAFKQVLAFSNQKINQTICDMNGERYRADEFGFTILRTSEHFVDAGSFQAPADCWGDVGAASGPLFVSLAVCAAQRGYAKGPFTLVWTSSERGERAAVLIQTDQAGSKGIVL